MWLCAPLFDGEPAHPGFDEAHLFADATARAADALGRAAADREAALFGGAAFGVAQAEFLRFAAGADVVLADLAGLATNTVAAVQTLVAAGTAALPVVTGDAWLVGGKAAETGATGHGAVGRAIRADHDHGGVIRVCAAELETPVRAAGFARCAALIATGGGAADTASAGLAVAAAGSVARLLGRAASALDTRLAVRTA